MGFIDDMQEVGRKYGFEFTDIKPTEDRKVFKVICDKDVF